MLNCTSCLGRLRQDLKSRFLLISRHDLIFANSWDTQSHDCCWRTRESLGFWGLLGFVGGKTYVRVKVAEDLEQEEKIKVSG